MTIGESGAIGSIILYSDSTEAAATGHATLSYTVSAAKNAGSAFITMTTQTCDASGTLRGIVSTVEQINENKTLSIISETMSFPLPGTMVALTSV